MKTETKNSLFLIEFYTNHPRTGQSGWEINFAWVYAADKASAKDALKISQGKRFDVVITCDEQAEITELAGEFRVNTADANLFFVGTEYATC